MTPDALTVGAKVLPNTPSGATTSTCQCTASTAVRRASTPLRSRMRFSISPFMALHPIPVWSTAFHADGGIREKSAIDQERRAADIAGAIGREESAERGDLVGRGRALHRQAGHDVAPAILVAELLLGETA